MSSIAQFPHRPHARLPSLAAGLLIAIAALAPLEKAIGQARPATPPAASGTSAAAVSDATLQAIFDAEQIPERMRKMMQAVNQAQLDSVERIPDPAERARKRKSYASAEPVLAQHFEWQRLRPLIVKTYQAHYTEADAQALLAFYRTAPGKLHLDKLQPAMIEASLALSQFMDERLDAILESSDVQGRTNGPRPLRQAPWRAADAHAAAAGDLARLLMQKEFNARMQRLESAMAAQMGQMLPPELVAKQKQWFANISRRIRSEIRFDTVLPLIVAELRKHLSEDELKVLLATERSPARAAQRAKETAADDALEARLKDHLRNEIFPALLAAMLAAEDSTQAVPASSEVKR